jgi:hypothetical protein
MRDEAFHGCEYSRRLLVMTRGIRGYRRFVGTYRLLNATVVQSKNCLFAANITIHLNNVTATSASNGI